MDVHPVVLEGDHVRLEPLDLDRHWDGLCEVALDPSLWRFTASKVANAADLRRYLDRAILEQQRGTALPFAIVDRASDRVAGSTRFGAIAREHRRVEIGWTFLGARWQRSPRNTEAKLLMLRHAFETWRVLRVELKTSRINERSQDAMRRLGLVEEGTFRKWMIQEDGTPRDVVWFAATDDDWPALRDRLHALLAERDSR